MFAKKLSTLFRASGCFARSMTSRVLTLSNTLPPSTYKSSYQPLFCDPSLIKQIQKNSILDLPIHINQIITDVPKIILPLEDITNNCVIEDPTKVIEQRAARLVVIRRKKMKKHKRKKLKKKMKYVWAKLRQRREMRKEKEFQAELMAKVVVAQNFDAVLYANEKIQKANTVLLPRYWKGKRLPEAIIKEELEKKRHKYKLKLESIERRKKIKENVSDYNV